jgi:hypothetical protein
LFLQDPKKLKAAAFLSEDFDSVNDISRATVKSTRKIDVGPFSSHVRKLL